MTTVLVTGANRGIGYEGIVNLIEEVKNQHNHSWQVGIAGLYGRF